MTPATMQPAYEHEFGLCLLFKDSAAYLEEWLRFYYVQGCRRFYLFNNDSSDHFRSVLEPWIAAGLVVLETRSGTGIQAAVYDECLARARGQVKWLAFLDDDEFLFSPGPRPLLEVLNTFDTPQVAGLAACWLLYGSSGHEHSSSAWVTARFTRCVGYADRHVKCIVRPERISHSVNIGHQFAPLPGFQVLTENGKPIDTSFAPTPSFNQLRINHYLIKSWQEWSARRSRPQADTGQRTPHPESSWRTWDKEWCAAEDTSITRFHPAMRSLRLRPSWLSRLAAFWHKSQ